jgi:hypothetical protein
LLIVRVQESKRLQGISKNPRFAQNADLSKTLSIQTNHELSEMPCILKLFSAIAAASL